ncbi:MAG: ArnT family glycosyltransferase [Halobacteriota archaeon]
MDNDPVVRRTTSRPFMRRSHSRSSRVGLLATLSLAAVVGLLVYVVSVDLFPYHSVNDDEGVYLLQASMLLDGQLFLYPGALADAVRPWFFVVSEPPTAPGGVRMYSKYSPVAPALFALGSAFGVPRLVLGVVAAGTAALVYVLSAAAFDRRVGVVAMVTLAGAPLFLLSSSVFLSYAPTTLLNLAFAACYVRAARRQSVPAAIAAGSFAGLAFFSRPYTAVLFAVPFVVHALWSLARAWQTQRWRETAVRTLAVGLSGLAFVGLALGYNAVVTGDPTVFPYEAFGPRDGIGFGERALLGYEQEYTPQVAAETTVAVLAMLATEWTVAGPLGTVLAAIGAALALAGDDSLGRASRWSRDEGTPRRSHEQRKRRAAGWKAEAPRNRGARSRATAGRASPREVRLLLAGVVLSVSLGNAYFWGNLNGLENGLFDLLGPYYHFDLVLPLSAFAAAGIVGLWRRLRWTVRGRFDAPTARLLLLAALVVSTPVVAAAELDAVEEPVSENRLRTESLAAAYAPFERQSFDDAVVFTPDTYGDWQQHPFQYLRNDPGFDGPVVFAVDGGPERDVRVLDATANRTPYRFTYRGAWTGAVRPVTPVLQPLEVLAGDRIEATTTVGVPEGMQTASVRIETEDGYARYVVEGFDRTVTAEWAVYSEGVAVTNLEQAAGSERVSLPADQTEVDLVVTFVDDAGASVTYRQELTVDSSGGSLRAVWPPETRICRLTTECGTEGTWVGEDGTYLPGVSVEVDARAVGETN